jgi:cytochrome c5
MKNVRLVSLLLVFVLVLTPLTVFAQDDDEIKLEEFVTDDELLTVGYPEDWTIEANDIAEAGVPGVMMANSEDALGSMMAEETETNLAEGEAGIAVLLLPVSLLGLMGIEVPAEGELDLVAAVEAFFTSTLSEEDQDVEVGEAEEIEFGEEGEEITAAYLEVSDDEVDGAMLLFEVNDGVLALVFVGAYPGEYSDELQAVALAVAESIEFEATGDELMALIMGGGMTSSTLDGEALVAERCTVCHSAERIDAAEKDEAGWTETVERMIGNGAVLTDEEKAAVIEYLSTRGEEMGSALDGEALVAERCTVCHSAERIDAADKDEAGWTTTVERMIGNGAVLTDEEKAAVIEYLTDTH